jgi:crotonobetaine/carnitine-CoA ligase
LTEAGTVTGSRPDDDFEHIATTVGVPWPGFDVRIVGNDGATVSVGEPGEVVVRGDTVMRAYLDDPDATRAAIDGDGWLHTGDLGTFDAVGHLHFVDREKDAIRRRGENISSFEVEAAVARHEGVAEVAAYAVPSELGEDEVMIAVLPSDPGLTAEALHAFCREVLPRFSLPSYIRFVAEMPYTPTNKIRKVRLREDGVTADTWRAQ